MWFQTRNFAFSFLYLPHIFSLSIYLSRLSVENFRCLCTGEKGLSQSGRPLHYKESVFHRIIPGFMCQGEDNSVSLLFNIVFSRRGI